MYYRLLAVLVVHTLVVVSGVMVIVSGTFWVSAISLGVFALASVWTLFHESEKQWARFSKRQKKNRICLGCVLLGTAVLYVVSPGMLRCDPVSNWGFNQLLGGHLKAWSATLLGTPDARIAWQYSRFNHRRLTTIDPESLPALVRQLKPREVSIQGEGAARHVDLLFRNWGLQIGADDFGPEETGRQRDSSRTIRKLGPGIYRYDITSS
jgi:hypothetical protein